MTQPDPTPGKEVVGIHVIKDMEECINELEKKLQDYEATVAYVQDLQQRLADAVGRTKELEAEVNVLRERAKRIVRRNHE